MIYKSISIQKKSVLIFFVFLALILILSISFFVNYSLYKRLMQIQIDPTATWFNSVIPTKDSLNANTLFIGDSRISQWQEHLPLKNSVVYGFSGFTSEQIKLSLSLVTIPINIDTVYIQVGINDLKSIAFFEDKSFLIQQRVFNNIKAISDIFIARNIKVYVLTIIPSKTIVYPRKFIWSDSIEESIRIVNGNLLGLESPNFEVIDVSSSFINADYLFKDSLHLNSQGYELLNNIIHSKIKH